jgi:hypothetical protein
MKLSEFSNEEAELLAALPYKAGVYVSHSDDVEGESDDEKEMRALERSIIAIGKLHKDDEFVQDVIQKAIALKPRWNSWADDAWHAPEHAAKAAGLVKAKGGERGLKKYAGVIMEISATVARAAGEHGAFDEEEPEEGFFSKIISGFSGLSHNDPGHPMNVSASEDSALSKLAAAFKI